MEYSSLEVFDEQIYVIFMTYFIHKRERASNDWRKWRSIFVNIYLKLCDRSFNQVLIESSSDRKSRSCHLRPRIRWRDRLRYFTRRTWCKMNVTWIRGESVTHWSSLQSCLDAIQKSIRHFKIYRPFGPVDDTSLRTNRYCRMYHDQVLHVLHWWSYHWSSWYFFERTDLHVTKSRWRIRA